MKIKYSGLMFAFTVIIFFVLIINFFVLGTIVFIMIQSEFISVTSDRPLINPMIIIIIVSAATGFILTTMASNITLAPIKKIIEATERMAQGEFSTRLSINQPRELKKLANSFNYMAEELENTEMLHKDFINNFSHEFKTPIISMRGYAKMLKYHDLTDRERSEYLDIIISESERLAQLSTNVLKLSALERQNGLDCQNFNVTEQIRVAISVAAQKWNKKDPSFIFDAEDIKFYGDSAMLNELWLNLIDNAIKFSGEPSEIYMKLENKNHKLIFTISDNGPGISDKNKTKVFKKFYQVSESHTTQGNGLGLAICKRIVQLHGGTIQITDFKNEKYGSSTAFEVRMPIKNVYEPEAGRK